MKGQTYIHLNGNGNLDINIFIQNFISNNLERPKTFKGICFKTLNTREAYN